jgi:hypothetical protein
VATSGTVFHGDRFGGITVAWEWRGEEATRAYQKAAANIVKQWAAEVIKIAKSEVHIITGTLRRSIKADQPGASVDMTDAAKTHDLGQPIPNPLKMGDSFKLVVGGTTFYAIYEELYHPYMHPALRSSQSAIPGLIKANRVMSYD